MGATPQDPRIFVLETGYTPLDLFRDAPEMDCFHAWPRGFPRERWSTDAQNLSRACHVLQPGRFDLAVVDAREFCFLRRHASLADGLFRLVKFSLKSPRAVGNLLLFRRILQLGLPVAWINRTDRGGVPDGSAWFFDRCHAAFIREMHPDPRMAFLGLEDCPSLSRKLSGWKESPARYQERIQKIFPISLGLPDADGFSGTPEPPKEWDVLYGYGQDFRDKPLRDRLLEELKVASRRLNLKFQLVDRLPKSDWIRAMQSSHLCFSPPGVGWDCWRHYEAMAAGCVPLLTYPTILGHHPPVDGLHAFYFAPEPGGLTRGLEQALSARPRWAEMAKTGRGWVAQHHAFPVLRSHVMQTTLRQAGHFLPR